MKKLSVILSVLALSASLTPLQADIDFTLGTKHESADAPDPENRYITDGENHIYLRIPLGWQASSSAAKIDLLPDQPSSQVQISQMHGVKALPLDPDGLAALRKSAQAAIPDGAKNVKPVAEVKDLLPVFGWKSFEVTFQYEFFGQQLQRSVLYINMLPGRVVQVSVTSTTADFENVHEKTRKLMFGWFEPKRDLSPDEAREYEEGSFKGS